MGFEGDLQNLSLGDVFQNIQTNGLSGTLCLESPDENAYLYFSSGGLAAVSSGPAEGRVTLEDILRTQRVVDGAILTYELKIKGRRALHNHLAHRHIATLDEQREAAAFAVRERVYEVFAWPDTRFRFTDGKPDSALFDRALIQIGVDIPLTGLLMEAARRQDDWARLQRVIPSFKEHYLALGAGDDELGEVEREVLARLDGATSLEAVTAALPHGRFTVAEAVAALLSKRLIRPVDAEDLRRQAETLEAEGEPERAVALLLRSLEIERGSLAGRERLAGLLEQLERWEEAADHWKMRAFVQLERADSAGALESYARAIAAAPDDLPLRRKQLDLMLAEGHHGSALAAGKELAAAALRQDLSSQAIAVYEELLKLGQERAELRMRIAEVHIGRDDLAAAIAVYREEARAGMKSGDLGSALLFYKKILQCRDDDVEAAKQVYEIESGIVERRRQRRQRILRRVLLVLFLTPLLVQTSRELLAARALRATWPGVVEALSGVRGAALDEAAQALAEVRADWPWTSSQLQLSALTAAWVEEEARRAESLDAAAGHDLHEARLRLEALRPLTAEDAALETRRSGALALLADAAPAPEAAPARPPAGDEPPVISALRATATTVAWPGSVALRAEAFDPNGGPLVFRWTASSGRLAQALSSSPTNTWQAPHGGEAVEVTVVARDASGLESEPRVLTLQPTGAPEDFAPRFFPYARYLGDHGAVFDELADLSFDAEGRAWVLDDEARTLTQVDAAWRVLARHGYDSDHDFVRLRVRTVDGKPYAWLLDRTSSCVLRFPLEAADPFAVTPRRYGRAGDGTNGALRAPADLAVGPAGEVYVLDRATGAVHLFGADGKFQLSVGARSSDAGVLQLAAPVALALDPHGRLALLDDGPRRKVVFYEGHRPSFEVAVAGSAETPVDLDFDPHTGRMFVLTRGSGTPLKGLRPEPGAEVEGFGPSDGFGALREVTALAVAPHGELFVVGRSAGDAAQLVRFAPGASGWRVYGTWGGVADELSYATKLAADRAGNVAVLAPGYREVLVFAPDGWLTARFGAKGRPEEQLDSPVAIAADGAGQLYVLDSGHGDVRRYRRDGKFLGATGVAGDGAREISDPIDLYAAPDGALAVLMYRNEAPVQVFDAEGTLREAFPLAPDEDINYPVSIALADGGDALVGCNGPVHIKRFTHRAGSFVGDGLFTPVGSLGTYGDLALFPNGFAVYCDPGEARVGVLDRRLASLAPLSDDVATRCPSPLAVAADGLGGIFVLDGEHDRVAVFSLGP